MHLDSDAVQASVAGVLSNLSVDNEIEREIASEGGIEAPARLTLLHSTLLYLALLHSTTNSTNSTYST